MSTDGASGKTPPAAHADAPPPALVPDPRPYVEPRGNPVVSLWRGIGASFGRFIQSRPSTLSLPPAVIAPILLSLVDRRLLGHLGLQGRDELGALPGRPYAFPLLLLAVLLFLLSFVLRGRFPVVQAHLSGALAACALVCFGVAVILLPFSIVGIMAAGLGLLGLVPWATFLCLLRAAIHASRDAAAGLSAGKLALYKGTGFVVVFAVAFISGRAGRLLRDRAIGDFLAPETPPAQREAAARTLHILWWYPQVSPAGLAIAEDKESQALWTEITGLSPWGYED
jgi:hypothetical protein